MFDAGRLALVVRAGAGYDNVDVAAASARGIYVANCPGKNSLAVAELAFGLMLALDGAPGSAPICGRRWARRNTQGAGSGQDAGLLGSEHRTAGAPGQALQMHLAPGRGP
jgi:D-3-phosphoglycerate dehydrogenase